jgi:LPXTG-motif cell wall-anchored protein
LEITPDCASAFVGQTLAAGASLSCDFTLPGYSPAAGSSKPNTATVVVHKTGDPTKKSTVQATAVVNTPLTPPLNLTIDKVNDANGDGTFGEDETGTSGAAVAFKVTITNNSAVAVVIDSISDIWPGATAITPACSTQVVGITLAANGGSVSCDFTVAGYVPPAADGAKVNTVTVTVHEDGKPGNSTSQHDTSTVRGVDVLGEVITHAAPAPLPATGSNTTGLFMAGLALLAMGSFLLLMSNRLSGAPLALRLPRANGSMLFTNNSPVIQRNPGYRAAPSRRAPSTSRTSGRPTRGNNRRR